MQFAVPISKCVYIHSYGYIGPRGYTQLWMLSPLLLPMWNFNCSPKWLSRWPPNYSTVGWCSPRWLVRYDISPFSKPSLIVCLCCHKLTKRTMGLWGTPLCLRSLWHSFKPTICKVHGFAVPWWRKLWRNPVKLILDFPYWNSRSSDDKKVLLVLFTLFEVFVISILRGYCNWWASFLYFFGVLFRRPASVYQPNGIMGHLNSNTALHGTTHLLLYIMLDPD